MSPIPDVSATPQVARRGWRPFRSVRSRILAVILIVTAGGMVVAGGTAYLVERERTLSQIDSSLVLDVGTASDLVRGANPSTLDGALKAIVRGLRPGTNEATFALVDGSTALVPGGTLVLHPEKDPTFVARVLKETHASSVVRGTAHTTQGIVRYVAIPVIVRGQAQQGVFVVAVDLGAALKPIDDAFKTYAIVAGISLLVVGLVGWFVAGRLLRPIRRLRETAERITASDSSQRIEVIGNDDVSDLTVTFNDMLDRLEGALTGQRRLLDDVGHELKTPITIVRGHLELMRVEDLADVSATRELAIDELDRMSGLVHDISDLALVYGQLRLRVEPTDVASLTQRVRVKASALSSTNQWIVTGVASVTAEIDPERMTQALLQLAANAVKHGFSGGVVEIESAVEGAAVEGNSGGRGQRLVFRLSNQGPAIHPEVARAIFERFHRGTEGRRAAGSGLGLAIVAAIAHAHGGEARVEPRVGGPTFAIDIPLVLAPGQELAEEQENT